MAAMTTRQISFPIRGMTCASCTEKIQTHLNRVDGVIHAHVNFATEHARVMYDPARTDAAALVAAVRASGFDVALERTVLPLSAIGNVAVSRDALVNAHLNWRARRVEIEWLADAQPSPDRASFGTTLHLLAHLLRSMAHRN
jgi:copper chaperone CopZ